jgi:hypothetical protein
VGGLAQNPTVDELLADLHHPRADDVRRLRAAIMAPSSCSRAV